MFNMAMMPGNPMLEGLLASVAANNPEVVANAAASAGIPPPGALPGGMGNGGGSLGAFIPPQGMRDGVAQAGQGIGPWDTTVNPAQAGAQPNPMGFLQGFKAPQAPSPVFSGGVSGSQKAPEGPSVGMGAAGAQGLNNLIAALMQQSNPGQAPGALAQYLGG